MRAFLRMAQEATGCGKAESIGGLFFRVGEKRRPIHIDVERVLRKVGDRAPSSIARHPVRFGLGMAPTLGMLAAETRPLRNRKTAKIAKERIISSFRSTTKGIFVT